MIIALIQLHSIQHGAYLSPPFKPCAFIKFTTEMITLSIHKTLLLSKYKPFNHQSPDIKSNNTTKNDTRAYNTKCIDIRSIEHTGCHRHDTAWYSNNSDDDKRKCIDQKRHNYSGSRLALLQFMKKFQNLDMIILSEYKYNSGNESSNKCIS